QPLAVASRRVEEARSRGYDSLAADNARAWARRWETDIVLDGNPALQRVVRSMLFYLLCSADSGTALGIPPMGLSSAGYYGHIFWDSDTWVFPALVLTHPDVARSMVDFRARTLPAARKNARANGYRGAQYPWEADEIGSETTPHFAAQNASSEIHVNGDVALAQWQYYLATGDSSWLARTGFPVIGATADFWVSRANYDSTGDRYHIRNVVSVAEGLIGVHAYPLGVPMSEKAKRTHLDQAVRRLADEAAGAMMGITLLSVDAAELGDRRLVDSLLPFSYQGHLRGPFLMLSETPTNDALSFLT